MRTFVRIILASTILCGAPAGAQVSSNAAAPTPDTGSQGGASDTNAPPDGTTPQTEIVVIGKGLTRQVQHIGQLDISLLSPGTAALKALEKLPSVNFQSADPFGAYEWSQRITVRGFDQSRLGFTLDGIPLGNQNYGNNNGLHTSRAISSENVGSVVLTQGAGALGTQATNNLGGTIEFFSRDPSPTAGADANITYGSFDTIRGFARLESGGGVARGYISYGYLTTDKWKGFGKQRQHQVNAKGIIDAGAATITGFFDFSDRREQDYQDLSLDMIRRLGYRVDNITNNFPLAVLIADVGANRGDTGAPKLNPAAGTTYPAPYSTVDDVYFDASGLRKDYLGSVGIQAPLGGSLKASLKGYFHNNNGQGTWFTPYVPSPSGVPISVRTTEYRIRRKGAFGDISGNFGFGEVTVGGWYERNNFNQARRFYGLSNRTTPSLSARDFLHDPFFTQWEFNYHTDIYQYFVRDRLTLGDLTVDAGWKGFDVKNRAVPVIQAGRAAGTVRVRDWFQPSIGINYRANSSFEVYASFSQSTEAHVAAFTAGPFSTTQAGFDAIKGSLKPERSDTYETGLRFRSGAFKGSLGAYLVNFHDRLLGITTGAGIVGNPVVLQNVGGVRSAGIEAVGDYRLGNGFALFASYAYNDATYRDNVVNSAGTVLAATKGKTAVDAPRHMLKAEARYDSSSFFGRIGVDYMSKRYFTYTNDQSVPGRTLIDATLGYRFSIGMLKRAEIQGNVSNLFDKRYISTIGSNGFGNSGDNQTLLAASPRQFLATLRIGI